MAVNIRTPSIDDFLGGGGRRNHVRAVVLGGQGVGKTRMTTFWPRAMLLATEQGYESVLDRPCPIADCFTTQDVKDTLAYVKRTLEPVPFAERKVQTLVLDTLDKYQTLLINERLAKTGKETLSGFDDWGYIDTRIKQMLDTLLNMDMNVVVLVHDKTTKVKDGESEIEVVGPRLKGDIKDSLFDDFALVGYLDTKWVAGATGRTEQRVLTFKRSPRMPFLKDRFGVMPTHVPINFTPDDFGFIHGALLKRMAELEESGVGESTVIAEVPTTSPVGAPPEPPPPSAPIAPNEVVTGGPLPPQEPAKPNFDGLKRPELLEIAKQMRIPHDAKIKVAELRVLLGAAANPVEVVQPTLVQEPEGIVDTATGEIVEPTEPPVPVAEPQTVEEALANVQAAIPATVVEETPVPQPATNAGGATACEECSLPFSQVPESERRLIRIAFISKRKYLCPGCLEAANKVAS